jgi:hypothetical protein
MAVCITVTVERPTGVCPLTTFTSKAANALLELKHSFEHV